MPIEIVHPWDVETTADRWKWAVGYLSLRGVDPYSKIYGKPKGEDRLISQIDCIVRTTLGSRNWALCMCESSAYIRNLYSYVMATYVFTTGERACIADADDLIVAADQPDSNIRDIIEYADLLLICHCEPEYPQFKWKKAAIANILHRRKFRKLSTIIEVFTTHIPTPLPKSERKAIAKTVSDSFGASVYDLFTGENHKHLIVRTTNEKVIA